MATTVRSSSQLRIDAFDSAKISLELWLSLLEANFANLEISEDDKKKHCLLVSLGTETFAVLGNICAPDLPHTKSYSALVELLKNHYVVKPSYHRSLIAFQQRKKKPDESLNNLYADLKALAKNCSFGNQFDSRVRDQLFMAVEQEVYFPNLVAENIDLQSMTSITVLERILNLEKAFVGEKIGSDSHSIKGVRVHTELKNTSCKHCGYPHDSFKCRFKNRVCNLCKKRGHLQQVCREMSRKDHDVGSSIPSKPSNTVCKSKGKKKFYKKGKGSIKTIDEEIVSSDEPEDRLLSVRENVHSVNAEEYNFLIADKSVPFEIDSGATVSTLCKDWVERLDLVMKPGKKKLCAYDNKSISVLGKIDTSVKYNGVTVSHVFYVVDSLNNNLCGKDLMKKVGIYIAGLDEMSKVHRVGKAEALLENYVVDSSKPISSIVAQVHVKSNASPKFVKARTVPFHHKEMVEKALDKLISDGIIESVTHSEWGAPIVPVMKSDKLSMRICADFKELNKQIECDQYPLPRIDELLSSVGSGKVFSKIDLQNAYLQIPVDEKSQEFLVISTHKGLFKYKRLPFGLSSSPAIFQRFISQMLVDIEGVEGYLDDIIVSGETQEIHDERLNKVLKRLQEHNVQINKKKSVLSTSCIDYLGYQISDEGIKPSPKKLEAILNAPAPTSVQELQSFLGMVTYYCKFVRDFSTKLSPLYDLLKKGQKFKWTKSEQNVFQFIKNELSAGKLLTNFDGKSPLIIEVDASPIGIGCVLLQKTNDKEAPVYFASKKLSPSEQNYSQVDKEGLALVFGVQKFRYFLLGRNFVARTDHKPLLGLFGKGKQIPPNANARIQRWALLLSQYDFELVHKPGKENVIADALSRLPVNDDEFKSRVPAEYIKLVELLDFDDISFENIKRLTQKDPVLSQLLNCLKFGWNGSNSNVVEYSSVKADLNLHNGIILYRNRVLIPVDLRCKVLEHLHSGHNGISAMKAEARNWVWWPKIDDDITEVTKSCHICFKNFENPKSTVLTWSCSGKIWSRLHIDYAGPVENKYFLVIVDSYSKFLDVHVTNSMTSNATIELLRKSFCNFGLPDVIVSDNAPYFVSQEMKAFFQKNGIQHVTPAPYNPASNGLAERAVRTLKEGLKKFTVGSLNTRICRILYNQRKTVHSSTNKSPAEVMFNRNFRVTIESVKLEPKKGKEKSNLSAKLFQEESKSYKVGDAVYVKNFGKGEQWLEGQIAEVLGLRNYHVQVHSFGNIIWKRHADQIMHRFRPIDQEDSISFVPNCSETQPLGKNPEAVINIEREVSQSELVNYKPSSSLSSTNQDNRPTTIVTSSPVQLRRSSRVVKPPDRLDL